MQALNSTFRANTPQLFLDIDRVQVKAKDVPLDSVFSTLQAYLGSAYVNDFNRFGRLYKVYIQAEPEYRSSPEELSQFYVRNRDGGMVPLTTLVDLEPDSGPAYTNRFNLFRTAEIIGGPAEGYSSADALTALEVESAEKVEADNTGDRIADAGKQDADDRIQAKSHIGARNAKSVVQQGDDVLSPSPERRN